MSIVPLLLFCSLVLVIGSVGLQLGPRQSTPAVTGHEFPAVRLEAVRGGAARLEVRRSELGGAGVTLRVQTRLASQEIVWQVTNAKRGVLVTGRRNLEDAASPAASTERRQVALTIQPRSL